MSPPERAAAFRGFPPGTRESTMPARNPISARDAPRDAKTTSARYRVRRDTGPIPAAGPRYADAPSPAACPEGSSASTQAAALPPVPQPRTLHFSWWESREARAGAQPFSPDARARCTGFGRASVRAPGASLSGRIAGHRRCRGLDAVDLPRQGRGFVFGSAPRRRRLEQHAEKCSRNSSRPSTRSPSSLHLDTDLRFLRLAVPYSRAFLTETGPL